MPIPPFGSPPASQASFLISGKNRQVTYNVRDYGAVGNGSTDDTTAFQNALNAAASAGGGTVFASAATYIIGNIQIDSNTILTGTGIGTVLKAKTGTTGNLIALKTPASTVAIGIRDLKVDCNNLASLKAIYLDNTSVATNSLHRLQNLWIYNSTGDSLTLGPAVIETIVDNCFIFNGGANGFVTNVAATDNRITRTTVGQHVGHGYYNLGNNNHFTDDKAYYCGYNVSGGTWNTGYNGFHFVPASSQDLHQVTLVACEAQNNAHDGFHFDGSASGASINHITAVGLISDGNNEANDSGSAYYANSVQYSYLEGASRSQSPAHKYGLALYGVLTSFYFNGDFTGATTNIYVDAGVTNLNTQGVLAGSVIPSSSFIGGTDGGFNQTRVVNYVNGVQLVAQTVVNMYVAGNDIMDITPTGVVINGTYGFKYANGAGSGKVLTSDASGNATWQTVSGGGITNNYNTIKIDQSGGGTSTYGALAGTVNGTTTLFTVSNGSYVSGTLRVFLNGQEQTLGSTGDFTETTPGSGTFTFAVAPPTGSIIIVDYVTTTSTSGNIGQPLATKTSAYTIAPTTDNYIRADATSGAFNVTLPSASTATGYEFIVKKIDSSANAVTIVGTIDGTTNYLLSTQYKYLRLRSNGTTWDNVGNN